MAFGLTLASFAAGESVAMDRAAVMAVLRRYCPDAVCRFGGYSLKFADGSPMEMTARGLEFEGELMVIGFGKADLSPLIVEFIFDVAKAGNACMFNAEAADNGAPHYFYLTNAAQEQELPERGSWQIVCTSAAHLGELIEASHARQCEQRAINDEEAS